jgi:hypothetical protein
MCYTLEVRLPLHLCLIQAVHYLIDPLFYFNSPNLKKEIHQLESMHQETTLLTNDKKMSFMPKKNLVQYRKNVKHELVIIPLL